MVHVMGLGCMHVEVSILKPESNPKVGTNTGTGRKRFEPGTQAAPAFSNGFYKTQTVLMSCLI
jgi:hypothetical protein